MAGHELHGQAGFKCILTDSCCDAPLRAKDLEFGIRFAQPRLCSHGGGDSPLFSHHSYGCQGAPTMECPSKGSTMYPNRP